MSDFAATDFTAGFASRLDEAARALALSYADAGEGFAPRDLKARAGGRPDIASPTAPAPGPVSFSPQPIGQKFQMPPVDEVSAPMAASFAPDSGDDPVAMARAAGYTEGFRDGHEQGELERQRDQAMLRELETALKSADRIDRNMIAARLRQTVLFLVSKIVGDTGVSPELLARRIEAAVELVADGAETATLRVHPDDLPLVEGVLPVTLHPVADTTVERGGFVLDSAATLVEDGPDIWLEQLAQAIDRVGMPDPRT